jgi:hypothetical protein
MTVRGTLLLAMIGALLVATWPAVAQDQWAQRSTYRLGVGDRDHDRDRDRDQDRGRDHRYERPYFTPTPMPFQGSEARRWQRKLDEVWGGLPAGRGLYYRGPVFYDRYSGPAYTCPSPGARGSDLGRYRYRQGERGYRGGYNWYDWYGY